MMISLDLDFIINQQANVYLCIVHVCTTGSHPSHSRCIPCVCRSLAARLQAVQSLVTKCTQGATKLQQSMNVGTCLSVIVLCFALVLANFTPLGNWSARHHTMQGDPYTTSVVKTRALLSIEYPPATGWPWLPAYWTHSGAEKCSSLLSVFLQIRFPKPYALLDGLTDVVLTEGGQEFEESDEDKQH